MSASVTEPIESPGYTRVPAHKKTERGAGVVRFLFLLPKTLYGTFQHFLYEFMQRRSSLS